VVACALARGPADRFQSAGEFVRALSALEAECATDSTGARPQQRRARRRPAPSTLIAGGAAVAALAVASLVAAPGLRHAGGRSPAIRTLAVLPLANLSGKPDQEYLADGLTEALITDLARIDGLNVISRTSVMQYKQAARMGQSGQMGQMGQMGQTAQMGEMRAPKPLPQIARELRADAVLEGSVIRDGERVRVTAQLIRAADDQHLWAQTYDHQVRDVLALQSEVATAVAHEVGLRLSPGAARAPRRMAVKPEAQEAYLKGLYYAGQWRLEDAIASFRRAVEIDSSHAPAYAGLARAYYFRAFFSEVPPVEAFGEMRRSATAALERDSTLADAHALLALVSTHHDWDWKAAEQHFARALELSPSNAQVHHDFAHLLLALGRRRESVEQSRRAVELDPANPMLTSCVGWHSLFDDQYDSTIVYAREAQRMMPSFWAEIVLGWGYLGRGDADAAVGEMRKAVALSGDLPFAKAALAHALARAGKQREARAILAELLDRSRRSYVSAYDLAIVYAGLGENDRAFEWLRRATDERSIFIVHLAWDARLDPLRTDPRFQELVARVGVPAVKPTPTRTASHSAFDSSSGRSRGGQT
jgi:TolB-like protein/Flp pilus assembly protein TadD